MKQKVILYKAIPEPEFKRLQEHFDVSYFDGVNECNKEAFIAALGGAEGLIGSSLNMNPELLKYASELKAVSTISVGTDQFDLAYLSKRGIPLMHTPGVLTETTADTMFTLIMCTARRVVELANMVKEGRWANNITEAQYGIDVHGKTLGIIGMGRIGEAIARRGHFGFGMKIQYSNRSRNSHAEQTMNAVYMEIEELLKTSDFVCVMTPLTPQTERLISSREFALMKETAIFVNGSRGRVVDEAALIEALRSGAIRAAGLDVYEVEPLPADSPLRQLNNAVLLPHIGSATVETRLNMVRCAIDNLINAFNGDISQNCANQHLLEGGR